MKATRIPWIEKENEILQEGLTRKVFHGQNITMARLELRNGLVVPSHKHINEQITTVLSGSILVETDTEKLVVKEGESIDFSPNVPHKVTALEDTVVMDTFSPIRSDWISGDDSYLRK